MQRGASGLITQVALVVLCSEQREQGLGGLAHIIEVRLLGLIHEGVKKRRRFLHLLELGRVDRNRLAIARRDLDGVVFIVVSFGLPLNLLVELKLFQNPRKQRGEEGREVLLQALANALGRLVDVLPLQIVGLSHCRHHGLYRLLCVRQELLFADGEAEQRHALESLPPEPLFLLTRGGHDEGFQHGHDGAIVFGEVLLDDACDHRDRGDRLLPDTTVLRRLELPHELFHERRRILRHQWALELFGEGHKRRHGHCSDLVDRVVHLLAEDRHHLLVCSFLEARRLVVRQLPERVQRSVPHAGMGMPHVLEEQLRHLVALSLFLHVLNRLLDGSKRRVNVLPLRPLRVLPDELEQRAACRIHPNGIHDTVNGFLADVV
mmetsp:Transcript_47995/g.133900  ORF Transcript_47995/g.133900 Transcript_47995/m.133900 type:complete len:377 (-) Transcript_47995:1128-2258(-)